MAIDYIYIYVQEIYIYIIYTYSNFYTNAHTVYIQVVIFFLLDSASIRRGGMELN